MVSLFFIVVLCTIHVVDLRIIECIVLPVLFVSYIGIGSKCSKLVFNMQ